MAGRIQDITAPIGGDTNKLQTAFKTGGRLFCLVVTRQKNHPLVFYKKYKLKIHLNRVIL